MTLSPQTKVSLTAATAISGIVIVSTSTWWAANILRDIRDEVGRLRTELQTELSQIKREVSAQETRQWNKYDMRNWAVDLERSNRASGLTVPDPRSIRP